MTSRLTKSLILIVVLGLLAGTLVMAGCGGTKSTNTQNVSLAGAGSTFRATPIYCMEFYIL